jgi:hypothetical protein
MKASQSIKFSAVIAGMNPGRWRDIYKINKKLGDGIFMFIITHLGAFGTVF